MGNLILSKLNDTDGSRLNFFESVRKITGYLAILNSHLPFIPFPNLQIISGQNTIAIKNTEWNYALYISQVESVDFVGLDNLREISNGDVLFQMNHKNLTAYSNSVMWSDIVLDGTVQVVPKVNETFDLSLCEYSRNYLVLQHYFINTNLRKRYIIGSSRFKRNRDYFDILVNMRLSVNITLK